MITSEIITIITNKLGIPEKNICQGVATDLNTFSQDFGDKDYIVWLNNETSNENSSVNSIGNTKSIAISFILAIYQLNKNGQIDSRQDITKQNAINCQDRVETIGGFLVREYCYNDLAINGREDYKMWSEKHTGYTATITATKPLQPINIIDVNC